VSRTLHKVTAFVTRVGADGRPDLLVMQHPTAGVQLPAGTVEEHEPVVEAAFRELAEETGLVAPRLVRHLGSEPLLASLGARAMLRTTVLRKGPSAGAPVLDAAFPRAYWCRVLAEVGAFSEIVYEELDLNREPPRVLTRFSGWVESDAIADAIERHFFHFEALDSTPERWVQQAEQRFECYWTALDPKPQLVRGQDVWLDGYYEALRSSLGM
jgi:8-oxo-dGTP pyrophosphatase MutT (NUDIX family)